MTEIILQLLNELSRSIKKNTAMRVNSASTKRAVVDVASSYFREYRDDIIGLLGDSDALHDYDDDWQHLIRLAQGNNHKKSYERIIKRIIKITKEANIKSHSTIKQAPAIEAQKISYSDAENILIKTLEELIPSAASSYQQGIADLNKNIERLSYRGTAAEFREAFREILDHLAPDNDVKKELWFKPETERSKPTMKQKVRYILTSRKKNKTQREAADKTVELIETLSGDIARAVYDRASLSTHIQTSKNEVYQMKLYLDALLFDLLEIAQS